METREVDTVKSRRSSYHPELEKHYPRVPHLLLPRPRLSGEIATGLEKRLLLLAAPSGYGKSVGLAQALSGLESPAFWYVFDELDTSVPKVATSFCRRLGNLAGIESVPIPSSDASPADCAFLITRLAHRIADRHVILVLDGLDRSHEQQSFLSFLQGLIDTAGSTLHLAVSSTERLDLNLTEVARAGQLARVTKRSLVFSEEETGTLLEMAWGTPVNPQMVAEVHRLTGGWPAGVSLLLLAFPAMPRTPLLLEESHAHRPWEMLRDEVLQRIGERDRELLLFLAFLPFFRPGDREELTAPKNSSKEAGELARWSPAFGVVESGIYAMSNSIRDELMNVAERIVPEERVAALRKQAAQLMEGQGRLEQALHSYLRIGDMEAANRILAAIGVDQLMKWDAARLGALATTLTSQVGLGLEANLVCARTSHMRGDFRTCDHYCRAGKKLAKRPQDLLPFVVFQARSQSYLSHDDAAETLWNEAKELLAKCGGSAGWAYVWLASHLLRTNRIKEAEGELAHALPILKTTHDFAYLGWALNRMAHLQLKTGRYRALSATLDEGREISRQSGAMQAMVSNYLHAALYWFSGRMNEAADCIDEALRLADVSGAERWKCLLLLMSCEIALMQGDHERAGRRLELAERLSAHVAETRGVERSLSMSQARYAWEVGAEKEAMEKFEHVLTLPPESQFGSLWDRLDVALAFLTSGQRERARDLIEAVLELAVEMESHHARANGHLLLAYLAHERGDNESAQRSLEVVWDMARIRGYRFMPASTEAIVEWANGHAKTVSSRDRSIEDLLLRWPRMAAPIASSAAPASAGPVVRIHTLGGLQLESAGQTVRDEVWKGVQKAKALFGLLLSSTSFRVTPDRAIDLLWPTTTEKARGRLHWAVSSLRKVLRAAAIEEHVAIEYEEPYYRLLFSQHVAIDHATFELLAERGLSESRKGNETEAVRYLEEAVGEYGGAFLEDALYQRFAEARRRQLSDLYTEVLHALARSPELYEETKLKWWQKALDHDPYDEEAYRGAAETALALGLNRKVLLYLNLLKAKLVEELDLPVPEWAERIELRLNGSGAE